MEFENCVLLFLKKQINDKAPVQRELQDIDQFINSEVFPPDRTKRIADLYLRLEKYLSQGQAGDRISADVLRGMVFSSCGGERADGDFPLLFLPAYLKRIRFFEHFIDAILKKAMPSLGEEKSKEILRNFEADNDLAGAVKNNELDWQFFEKRINELSPQPEKQEESARASLAQFADRLLNVLSQSVDTLRAELIFKESYQQLRDQLSFLEDVSQALLIIPKGILEEEKLEIMGKTELMDELRRRNQELEFALAQLSDEKKKVEEEKGKLAVALSNLETVDRAKSDFINVVSHQFRTPLSAIRWNNEILEDEIATAVTKKEDQEKLFEYNHAIHAKIIFIINILEDVYDTLAIEGRTMSIDRKPSQLWEIIDDVIRDVEKEAKDKKIELTFDRSAASLKEILLDQQKIRRVCTVLLRNAVHYTPEGGKVKIKLSEVEFQGQPAFSCMVQDTGIGIAPEDGPKLFAKFFRGKNAIQMSPDGAGLGLYLVKKFVEAHGGAVAVESEIFKGSTFTFVLPII